MIELIGAEPCSLRLLRTIALVSQKGGVGKSTLAASLGDAAAAAAAVA
jgi:Mrp family chromosome partitioning ATPase